MLLQKQLITHQAQQLSKKYLTVIKPQKIKTKDSNLIKNKTLLDRDLLISWLFLIGSLMFLFDGLLELTENMSIHVVIHLVSSTLFVIGSVLFIPTNKK